MFPGDRHGRWAPPPAGRRAAARSHVNRLRTSGDAGVTLIEVMVSLTIMTIFMAMFTTGVVQTFRATNKSESTSIAQSQLSIAFQRLDKEVRYASGISTPGPGTVIGSDGFVASYVEYLTTNAGSPRCTAWRLLSKKLQRHTWIEGIGSAQVWSTLASNVSVPLPPPPLGVTVGPFTLFAADATSDYQRLQLSVRTSDGVGASATSKDIRVNFTALNSGERASTSSTPFCTGRRP
jgi:prepilin-type N-terminal cleavage/methylation domain-containing protein